MPTGEPFFVLFFLFPHEGFTEPNAPVKRNDVCLFPISTENKSFFFFLILEITKKTFQTDIIFPYFLLFRFVLFVFFFSPALSNFRYLVYI